MSYSDPQTVTVATVAQTLPRVGAGTNSGAFASADGLYRLEVSHAYGKRTRRSVRLTKSKVSADVLIPSQNVRSSMSVYMVIDTPVNGFTNAEIKDVTDALVAYLTSGSGVKVTQLVGGES